MLRFFGISRKIVNVIYQCTRTISCYSGWNLHPKRLTLDPCHTTASSNGQHVHSGVIRGITDV